MAEKDETALTSQLPILVLQLLTNLALSLQRTGTLLVELVPLFLETLDLLLQTLSNNCLSSKPTMQLIATPWIT